LVKAGFNKFNFSVSKFKNMQSEILIHLTTALGTSKTVKLFIAAK
jgi:hypothetical protein